MVYDTEIIRCEASELYKIPPLYSLPGHTTFDPRRKDLSVLFDSTLLHSVPLSIQPRPRQGAEKVERDTHNQCPIPASRRTA